MSLYISEFQAIVEERAGKLSADELDIVKRAYAYNGGYCHALQVSSSILSKRKER